MTIKEIQRAVVAAWSPSGTHLAGGSAAQQVDASFNTSAAVELYKLDLTDFSTDLITVSSISSKHRFHKIVWGNNKDGVIVGGCDDGRLQIYNAGALLNGNDSEPVLCQDKHVGAVRALDFNRFQEHLLATGASDSETYIWDLNKWESGPMTPGGKPQPLESVQCVEWNKQVQHILSSVFSSRCVVWDLRKNEPVIKLSDGGGHVKWHSSAWNPDVSTQLCLASEDDLSPVVQLWDLRFATSPLKSLENHTRGILAIAWCPHDADLLLSCGKDNRILCWNPNSNVPGGEVVSEITCSRLSFDVAWNPRNPLLVSACTSDGILSVYSIMGSGILPSNSVQENKPDDFLGQTDQYGIKNINATSHDPIKSPKWLKKPVGASFGFGGKLVTFEYNKITTNQIHDQNVHIKNTVYISQVITEPELVKRSDRLEEALQTNDLARYCYEKADESNIQNQRYVWYFLKALFLNNSRTELLDLLGYSKEDIDVKLKKCLSKPANLKQELNNITNDFAELNCDNNVHNKGSSQKPFEINTSDEQEGLITQAILCGNIEAAVELCFESNRIADALILAMSGGPDLMAKARERYLNYNKHAKLAPIIHAFIMQDWTRVIDSCQPQSWREAVVAALTYSTDADLSVLCERLGDRLDDNDNALLCYICAGSLEKLVSRWPNVNNNLHDLQELIEVAITLRKAVELHGKQSFMSEKFTSLLSQYGLALATQGKLHAALRYLDVPTEDRTVCDLRDRIRRRLDYQHRVQPQPQQIQQNNVYATNNAVPKPAMPANNVFKRDRHDSFNVNAINQQSPLVTSMENVFNYSQPPPPHISNAVPQPPAAVQQPQPVLQQTQQGLQYPPKPFTPVSQMNMSPTHPPRPWSANSQGGSGLPRAKYVLDPSVQSNNSYGSYGQQFNASNFNSPAGYTNAIQKSSYPQDPSVPKSLFVPQAVSNSTSFPISQPMVSNTAQSQDSFYPNMPPMPVDNTNLPPPPLSVIAPYSLPSAHGWNDPPVIARNQAKLEYNQQEPITHPLYGSMPDQQQIPLTDRPPNFYNPVEEIRPVEQQQYGNNMFSAPPAMSTLYASEPTQQNAVQEAQIVEPPKEKPPIASEYANIQRTFDSLHTSCSISINNQQTRRKLDDVKRKLELMYDFLRDQKLSANTVTHLQTIVRMVEGNDYASALQIHTQLVSGSDFVQIASFMPGLKVLLQYAQQYGVYVR